MSLDRLVRAGWPVVVADLGMGWVFVGGCRRRGVALGCVWARADDVSKCRRRGSTGLPRDLPFEGFDYARPAVTLAPAFSFAGAVAW